MTGDVRDETRRNPALAERITAVLAETVPVIENFTELPVGRCTVRLVDPAAWRAEVRDYVARCISRDFTGYAATPEEERKAARIRKNWLAEIRLTWPTYNGMTLTTLDGEPETLIAPAALRHSGLDRTRRGLERFMVHEAVHHAQVRASAGIVIPPRLEIRKHPLSDRAGDYLMEGHADWVELMVHYTLFGDWPQEEVRRTSLQTVIRRQLLARRKWRQLQGGKPARRRLPMAYRKAALKRDLPAIVLNHESMSFVDHTVRQIADMGIWNKLWTDLALVPTRRELADPAAWLERIGLAP